MQSDCLCSAHHTFVYRYSYPSDIGNFFKADEITPHRGLQTTMRRITSIDADVCCDARTRLSQWSRDLEKLQDSTLQQYTAVADRCFVIHVALEATVRHDTAVMLLWIYVAAVDLRC